MKRKFTPLPPGEYTVTIDRVRKVRNKNQKRIHMTIVETGDKVSEVIKPDV
jgi:hypothetical protein